MKISVGEKIEIAGMIIEIVADQGDKWETRNMTTGSSVSFDKSMIEKAIKLGKAEKVISTEKK